MFNKSWLREIGKLMLNLPLATGETGNIYVFARARIGLLSWTEANPSYGSQNGIQQKNKRLLVCFAIPRYFASQNPSLFPNFSRVSTNQ